MIIGSKKRKAEEPQILETLQRLYVDLTGRKDVRLEAGTRLNPSIGLTSLGIVQFAVLVEEEYSIAVTNSALASFRTVRDVVKYIIKCRK